MKTDAYLRAAKLIDSGKEQMSCFAVERAIGSVRLYCEYFSCKHDSLGFYFGGSNFGENIDERRKNRVLALLFMHWISEDLP